MPHSARRVRPFTAVLGCLVSLGLGAVRASDPPTPIRFQPDWFPNAQFSGFFWAEVDGLYADRGLDVTFGTFAYGTDLVGGLVSGEVQFATLEAYILMDAVARGAPLVAVGAVLGESPAGYIYLADTGIDAPADLAGRRVGVHAYAETLLPFFVERAGLEPGAVEAVKVGHEIEALLDGTVDLHQGYATDEMLRLDAMTDRPVDILSFERMGLPMYSMVIVTSRAFAADHPGIVDAFLAASAEGWTRAMRSPEVAALVVNERFPSDDVDDAMVAAQAAALAPLVCHEDGPVLSMTRKKWAEMQAAYLSSGMLDRPVDLDTMLRLPAAPTPQTVD